MADDLTLSAAAAARNEVPLVQGISSNHAAGGMTYLQMVRRLRQECGVSGTDPASVIGLSGEMGRLANYIKQAWLDIQTMHNTWEFMKQPVDFICAAGQQKYTTQEMLIASFSDFKKDSFTISPVDTNSGEQDLFFLDWENFKYMHLRGTARDERNLPSVFTVNPQQDFLLGPTPDRQYRIRGECYAMPTELTRDVDRPACPGQFHMVIVYRAMQMYGQYEAATEVIAHGTEGYNKFIARMAAHQLPQLTFGAPLV